MLNSNGASIASNNLLYSSPNRYVPPKKTQIANQYMKITNNQGNAKQSHNAVPFHISVRMVIIETHKQKDKYW